MHDTAVSSAARARQNRMNRRRFERRFKRGAGLVAGLYVLAMIVAPERTTLPPAQKVSIAATFPIASVWRPAGEVLNRLAGEVVNRKAGEVVSRNKGYVWQKAAKPFAIDTVQNVPRATLTRWHRIYKFATRYEISVDLARKIHDTAIRQGIEPELGFRVVQMESEFKTRATSPVGAIGLTQLMLGTARGFEPNITREALTDAETNLRIGFRYLRALIRENKGNLSLALLTYNRGPVAVQSAIALGLDPSNGYDREVTKGYRGRGTLD